MLQFKQLICNIESARKNANGNNKSRIYGKERRRMDADLEKKNYTRELDNTVCLVALVRATVRQTANSIFYPTFMMVLGIKYEINAIRFVYSFFRYTVFLFFLFFYRLSSILGHR